MNPAEDKLAKMTTPELLEAAEKLRTRLQEMDYKGCYWDANLVLKLMELTAASGVELPHPPRYAGDLDEAERQLEQYQFEYLTRWGWKQTCQTPGSYWMWRRDFTPDDEAAMVRWGERNAQREIEIKEFGKPHTPNSPKPPAGYGVVCVPKDMAISMTIRALDEQPERSEGED